jgi:hypothetical protein
MEPDTSIFSLFAFGIVLIMLGMIGIVRRHRKKFEEEKKWQKNKGKYKYKDLRY